MDSIQLQQDALAATGLLHLLSFFDGSNIPESILRRGTSPQNRFSSDGEIEPVTAEAAGVDPGIVALIQDDIAFDAAIKTLLSHALVLINTDTNGSRSFSVHSSVQQSALQNQLEMEPLKQKWKQQAMLLICHAFPRGSLLDPRYGEIGRLMLPHVQSIVRDIKGPQAIGDLAFEIRNELAAMLIQASHFSTPAWKEEVMDLAWNLVNENTTDYLRIEYFLRQSSLLRMLGKLEKSNAVLEHTFPEAIESDVCQNAIRGQLVVSRSQNLLSAFNLTAAEQQLRSWQPLSPAVPSTMEKAALQARNSLLGKVLRYEGKFKEALAYLEEQLRQSEADNIQRSSGWRRVLMAQVADLYCELERPGDAITLLKPELDHMQQKGSHNMSVGRRLQLTYCDSLIKNGDYDEAQQRLLKLHSAIEAKPDLAKIAARRDFRIVFNFARIAHHRGVWDEALAHWTYLFETYAKEDFRGSSSAGVILYSISYTWLRKGNREEAISNATAGKASLVNERRIYTIPLQSYWRDYVVALVDGELGI